MFQNLERERAVAARYAGKRALDIGLSSLALVASLPVMLVIALAIALEDGGPVLFRQIRVGRDHTRFRIVKFRSMVVGAESVRERLLPLNEADGPLFKLREDPRVTRVGRLLRRHSLDELPQLLNVILGHMSLVGPRPALPDEVEGYDEHTRLRLAVKPGITGPWQIRGRSDLGWEQGLSLDLDYVRRWTIRGDLAILARTVRVVVLAIGGY